MTSTLLIFQIVLSLVITVAVLLQKSSSIGLGAYSGSNESMFGAKGPAGFLAKFTFSVALLFIVNTLALGYFYNQENSKSVVDQIDSDIPRAPVTTTTTAPSAPTAVPVAVETTPTPVEATVTPEAIENKEESIKTEATPQTDGNVANETNTSETNTSN